MEFLNENITDYKVTELKKWLQSIGAQFSFKNKAHYIERCEKFQKIVQFPWRPDQKKVLDNFLKFDMKFYCINAIFGAGKTTLLLGMLIHGIIQDLFKPDEVLFLSFNISIRNEIKRKLKDYGISSKVTVRTFDSVIYEICKHSDYPYMDLPNFEGKRKHAYKLCFEKFDFKLSFQPSIIFIDECQDLEKYTLDILRNFYPDSKIVFTGDIFQSIQKEPRESILWYIINNEIPDCYKMYMDETPRVPQKILISLKRALSIYYPEFREQISNWKSANYTSNCDIEWRTLESYTSIFEELSDFCNQHTAEESMILTFSSSITVSGHLGDISRLRRFLLREGTNINHNHKRHEPENYFLTTANSSKGLERDYVICFLTFPLEKAFINLSDDVVVNLITVAITRAKKKVIFYVPKYEDKYSRVLKLFDACPKPSTKIRNDSKCLTDFTYQEYLDNEASVTLLIRQSIIKYDTRIKLTENYAKRYKYEKIFEDSYDYKKVPKIVMEEEKQFVGIFIENLITSTWTGKFPGLNDDMSVIKGNPMYSHCMARITKLLRKYKNYDRKPVNDSQFEGIYLYSQVHLAISDKIFMDLSEITINCLKNFWSYFKHKCIQMKPADEGGMSIQSRLRMPWVTGVADVITGYNDTSKELTVYEIKASSDIDWVQNALIQAVIYSLMTGRSRTRIILINPFRNEKVYYSYDTTLKSQDKTIKTKNILYLRDLIVNDVLTYNINCLMAKSRRPSSEYEKHIIVTNNLFVHIGKGNASIIKMVSPIKCELMYNKYFISNEQEENKLKQKLDYVCRRQLETTLTKEQIINEIKEILDNNMNKDKIVYTDSDCLDLDKRLQNLSDDELNISDIYAKNGVKQYALCQHDSLHLNILHITKLYKNHLFS